MAFLGATTSLPAVYRPNDDRWNAARSCQLDENLYEDLHEHSYMDIYINSLMKI